MRHLTLTALAAALVAIASPTIAAAQAGYNPNWGFGDGWEFWSLYAEGHGANPFVGGDLGAALADGPGFNGDDEDVQVVAGLRLGLAFPIDGLNGGADLALIISNQFNAFATTDLQFKLNPLGAIVGLIGTARLFIGAHSVDFGGGGGLSLSLPLLEVYVGVDVTLFGVPAHITPSGLMLDVRLFVTYAFPP